MKNLSISEGIVPISELKANTSRLLARLGKSRRPIVVTQNGKPAAVLLSPSEFDRIREREAFLGSIAAGLADVEAGRTMTTPELRKRLSERRAKRRQTK